MKAKSTIQKEIRRLRQMAENQLLTDASTDLAYETYHALRWVIEDVNWTPHGNIRPCMKIKEGVE